MRARVVSRVFYKVSFKTNNGVQTVKINLIVYDSLKKIIVYPSDSSITVLIIKRNWVSYTYIFFLHSYFIAKRLNG